MHRLTDLIVPLVFSAGLLAAPHAARGADATQTSDPVLPAGYKLVYSQDFEGEGAIGDFEFTAPGSWRLAAKNGNKALEFFGKHPYKPKVRSPVIIGLLSGRRFGSFVLEADLLQTGKEYGHRDMCLFFSFVDPTKFYYCHMATKADKNAHNLFIVNDKPRTNIAERTTDGIDWGQDTWHRVRLVRDIDKGTIEAYFDNMAEPLMVANDRIHGLGHIGFGSFDDSGMVDNIRVYAPEVVEGETSFFGKKE